MLARDTRRRVSAILGLQWTDRKPDETLYGVLHWRAQADKLGRSWTVPVTAAVREAVEGLPRRSRWIFPHPYNAERAVTRQMAMNWFRATEQRAGLERVAGGGWHMFRRLWATERKDLSLKGRRLRRRVEGHGHAVEAVPKAGHRVLAARLEGGRRNIKAV